ncbi:hypothetical protein [Inhella proteolytica]|uniref:Uncharacterized protein n=1 Tax=Inhella proteolytica TaxID=2795029 RepID=A0A931J959_9BURK|nr:hypothetical protein [Inhella proteolytica]MBH9578662.1 hypothetical protein [Inhella proteolytica]
MQLSTEQMQQMKRNLVHSQARQWTARVDAALLPAQRGEPLARLGALQQLVSEGLAPNETLAARDVQQAAQWLQMGLEAGAPWRDTRAAALLNAAAALGALWFVDGRLLPGARQLPLQPTLPVTMAQLLAQEQGLRFKQAAMRERELRAGLHLAWQRALAQELGDAALLELARTAFAPHAEPRDDAPEPEFEDEALPLSPDAQAFLSHEQRLAQMAGLEGSPVARLCLAGDLLLGLGRCVRLATTLPPDSREPLLKEAIHAAAGFQR